MELFILDGIAPFFRGYRRRRINWSKVPFSHLERDGELNERRFAEVRFHFGEFARRAAEVGANALSIDDVAHLVPHKVYPSRLNAKIEAYRREYRRLFSLAAEHGLPIYLTTDVLFMTEEIALELHDDQELAAAFLAESCARVLDDFPEVAGVILRLGECDAGDVRDTFKSRLWIRTPQQARRWIDRLLPVFESRGRRLIVRTWTVGAYPIGDLIWNRETYDAVFDGLDSEALIVSMKYGESDFFRYLPLNKLLFRGPQRKIIELQTRREYEGCGEFPSFVGFDYASFERQLRDVPQVIGCMVWCQTGGWTRFRRLSFVGRPSRWNEINTFVTLRIFRDGASVEAAVRACHDHWFGSDTDWRDLLELLRLSDEVIKELLYVDDFARQKLFFRRTRLPTLLAVYWDRLFVNHPVRKVLRCFVDDGAAKIAQGRAALAKIDEMTALAVRLGVPSKDFDRMRDAFELFAVAREYYFGPYDLDVVRRLTALEDAYKRRHRRRHRYAVKLDFTRARFARSTLRWLLWVALRRQRGYRRFDRVVMVQLLAWLHPLIRFANQRLTPPSVRDQAMGVDSLFK